MIHQELIAAYTTHQMSSDLAEIANARPSQYYAVPPYSFEVFETGSACVTNANGINCLTYRSAPGRTLTTPHVAKVIADLWNRAGAMK